MGVSTVLSPIAAARDKLAAWLTVAEPMLQAMHERQDPGFDAAFKVWSDKLAWYEHLCALESEL